MKLKTLVLATSLMTSFSALAGTSILIVPQDGNVAAVIESLRQNGFQVGDINCSNQHDSVKIERVGVTKNLMLSCIAADSITNTTVVPFGESAQGAPSVFEGNATGAPSIFEGNATGAPSIFEGNATGAPSIFEGNATGAPSVFEGNATGEASLFEGNATGAPSIFEGNATGASAGGKASIAARLETAARNIHAKIYQLIME